MARSKGRFVVQRLDEGVWVDEVVEGLSSTECGRRWIRDNGESGRRYRVVSVKLDAVVKVQTVRKMSMEPVDA